ncbi:MAG: hypothetical protein KDE65_13300 [Burkholderiaceae bacterium]|nr:hypothetical protein [Burkholderiaceae bacterium]
MARHRATATTPSTGNTDPVQTFGDACNALSMAAYYARSGNNAGAQRKAIQGLAALRSLNAQDAGIQNPSTSGRA